MLSLALLSITLCQAVLTRASHSLRTKVDRSLISPEKKLATRAKGWYSTFSPTKTGPFGPALTSPSRGAARKDIWNELLQLKG